MDGRVEGAFNYECVRRCNGLTMGRKQNLCMEMAEVMGNAMFSRKFERPIDDQTIGKLQGFLVMGRG